MIETKERYEYLRKAYIDPFKEIHHEGLDNLFETIEALREVARAGHACFECKGIHDRHHGPFSHGRGGPHARKLDSALDALADWLTDG